MAQRNFRKYSGQISVSMAWATSEASKEAKGLLQMMLVTGETPEQVRSLIDVPEETEQAWRTSPGIGEEERSLLLHMLRFRKSVLKKFNQLLSEAA